MATVPPPIRTATAADEPGVIATLLLAFSADPAVRWTFSDPARYVTHFPDFVRAFGGRAFEHGSAHRAEDYAAAALWLPPGVHPDGEAMDALFERGVDAREREDGYAVLEQMGGYHPSEPHWYLPLIGVDPIRQGQGYGSALLRHALGQCDRDGLPAYLESSNQANVPLYERHGFQVIGTIQAGASPTFWAMLRPPH